MSLNITGGTIGGYSHVYTLKCDNCGAEITETVAEDYEEAIRNIAGTIKDVTIKHCARNRISGEICFDCVPYSERD